MEPADFTIQVLRAIRDEVKQTKLRLDETNTRLSRVEHRQSATEIRLATELVAVAAAVREVRDEFRALRCTG